MKVPAGLIIGFFFGCIFQIPADEKICAVIFFAALDSIFGAMAAKFNSNFKDSILICGFLINLIFGLIFIPIGNFFDMELYYIALLIFSLRIFKNVSLIKEFFLKKYT